MNINKKALSFIFLYLVLAAAVVVGGVYLIKKNEEKKAPPEVKVIPTTSTYKIDDAYEFQLKEFEVGVQQMTRIRISPDGKYMFIATLKGEILVYSKGTGTEFVKQSHPFMTVDTGLEGLPRENGLTGFAFAADYSTSKEIFLTYTGLNAKGELKNRVARVTLIEDHGHAEGQKMVVIFEGNVTPSQAHQIQNGVGVEIAGKSHFMFTIGDAFNSTFAHDLTKDAGKVMLIQRDGKDPLGARPYPKNKKIQAIGVRNAYDLIQNPFVVGAPKFLMTETGNEKNDKLVYGSLLSPDSTIAKPLDLLWDGTDASQKLVIADPYTTEGITDMNMFQWDPSVTPLDLQFVKGGIGNIQTSTATTSYFLISLFGNTGSTLNTPGKQIMLGKLDLTTSQPTVELLPFISRSSAGDGKQGQPVGMAVDPLTQDIYFGDIFESKIYKVTPGDNNTVDVTVEAPKGEDVTDMTTKTSVEIAIRNFGYEYKTVVVRKGTKITWTNRDVIHHTVTSDTGTELASDSMNQGDVYSHTFNTVGTFDYHCIPHPFMRASVVVVD